jgi:hypothetical protein
MRNIFALGEVLGKSASEVMALTVDEFNHWRAYFKIKNEAR